MVKAVNLLANATTITVVPTVGTTPTIVDQNHARQLPYSIQKTLGSLNGMANGTVSASMPTWKIFGYTRATFDNSDDVFQGTFSGTAPAREWIWTIFCQTMNGAAMSVACAISIEYTCVFTSPVVIQPS